MKLLILAGGKGTRLGFKDIPKPMVHVDEKPVLEYQIELAKKYGINEVFILSGYKSQSIIDYFKDGSDWGLSIKHITEKKPLGTAGSVFQLKEELNENFMVFYGDTIMDINLKALIAFDNKYQSIGTLLVHPNDHPFDSDIVELDNNELNILQFHPKNSQKAYIPNLVNAALYIFSPEIFNYIKPETNLDFGRDVFPEIIKKGGKLNAYYSSEYIKDMGTPKRIKQVEFDIKSGKVSRLNNENKRKAIFIDRDGVINKEVDSLCKIEDFELIQNSAEAIKMINKSEYLAIVVTNQPVIAKGFCSEDDVRDIHSKMEQLIGLENAYLDKIYFCPHHPESGFKGEIKELKIDCECRKPNTGMIKKAVKDLNIDLQKSYLIGDTTSDIKTGEKMGLKTILVKTGYAGRDEKYIVNPNYHCDNLFEGVKKILKL
jgi:mannose-1-phosphate guanylyltransferase / phosphomannomutase